MKKINARSPFFLDVDAETNIPNPTSPTQTIQVNCGDTYNTGLDVGDTIYEFSTPETGNVQIEVSGNYVPVKFVVEWDGVEQVNTGYIGLNTIDFALLLSGVQQSEINTGNPSTKNTTLTFNKTTQTPELIRVTATAPLVNDEYTLTFNCPEPPAVVIEQTTQINIWFDNSGSMNSTLSPLQSMVAGNLKSCLVQFYNNDGAEYDKYVQIQQFAYERTFEVAASQPTVQGATNCINIIFQDEASLIYHSGNPFSDQFMTTAYELDVVALRNVFTNNFKGYVTPIIFQVQSATFPQFKQLLQAVETGQGRYSQGYGLEDYTDRVKFYYDVQNGVSYNSNPTYYRDKIIQGINDLGFSITCP